MNVVWDSALRILAGVGGLEVAVLQLDGDEALHPPVEEQEVKVVVVAVERDALLPLDECEPAPSSGRNRSISRRIADLRSLAVRVGQPEEVEHVGVAEHQRRR